MRKPNYRELEHTGDIAIEVIAESREELFADALVVMGRLMVAEEGIGAAERRRVTIVADDDAEAMHDLLAEALNVFLIEGFIWCDAKVSIGEREFAAMLSGEKFDPTRHHLIEEIKAVTYHALRVEETTEGWRAVIVFDA